MLTSPGPLSVSLTHKGDSYWLRLADNPSVAAVATVWKHRPHTETALGNAVAMAHAGALIALLDEYRQVTNRGDVEAANNKYDRLKQSMKEIYDALAAGHSK